MRARLRKLLAGVLAVLGALFSLRDVFLFGGLACAACGAYQIYPPAAWILVGAVLMALAMLTRRPE